MSTNVSRLLRRRVTRSTKLVQRSGRPLSIEAVAYGAEYGRDCQDFPQYSMAGEPTETVNLVGRPKYKQVADRLREKLRKRIIAASDPEITVTPIH
jgi:DNA helicase IV